MGMHKNRLRTFRMKPIKNAKFDSMALQNGEANILPSYYYFYLIDLGPQA